MQRTGNQTGEEGLVGQVGVVLLEVLLGGSGELDGSELEAAALEAGDDGADKATLSHGGLAGVGIFRVVDGDRGVELWRGTALRRRRAATGNAMEALSDGEAATYLNTVRLDGNEAAEKVSFTAVARPRSSTSS